MDYKQLEAFEALLKHGSYSKAAKAIYISQPAMTVRIQSLEKFLDISLFKRNGHNCTLTVAGTVFSNYVRDIFNLHKESLQAINELKGLTSGSLRIGASSFSTYVIHSMIKNFKESFPGVHLSFYITNTTSAIQDLIDNKIELAIIASSYDANQFKAIVIGYDTLIWAAASDMPISNCQQITREELEKQCFIIREPGSNTRMQFDNWCNQKGFYPKNCLVMSQTEAIRRAVMNNLGISLISSYIFSDEIDNRKIKVINVSDIPIERPISIVMSKNYSEDTLTQAFIIFAKSYFKCK